MNAIALHRLIDSRRKLRRVRAREQLGGPESEDVRSGANSAPYQLIFDGLHRALASLSGKQRQVIQLLKWEGFSVREVAERTGMSESSVKVTAHRGYRLLRRLLVSGTDEQ